MHITFQINYHTQWGENLYVNIGGQDIAMHHEGEGRWVATVEMSPDGAPISYCYSVKDSAGRVRTEWGALRKIPASDKQSLHVFDRWHDRPEEAPFYSSAFRECFFKRDVPSSEKPLKNFNMIVAAPTVEKGNTLCICGSTTETGCWNIVDSVELDDSDFPMFRLSCDMSSGRELEFKLVVRDQTGQLIWEDGANRHVKVPEVLAEGSIVEIEPFRESGHHWKCAGTAIPVFSLRSVDDDGIGDFLDLKLMADWAKKTGQKIIQILPVNDTTMTRSWRDSYPYNSISSFALNPNYIRVEAIGHIPDGERKAYREVVDNRYQQSEKIDFEDVAYMKNVMLHLQFDSHGDEHLQSKEFQEFYDSNSHWLRPYAAFCVLRDRYNTADMKSWEGYSDFSEDIVEELERTNGRQMRFEYFVQFHADKQLKEARDYCHSLGICLKGDIPIGISRTSVDAWQYPRLFNLDKSAGAPPDDFAVLGQNWGFPTYNWDEMSKDGFKWWKDRFKKMADYFDAYRIDHLLGFFRIWEMDDDVIHGLLGTFNRTLPLSPDTMKAEYGFVFNRQLYTRPYITDRSLEEIFGEFAVEVKSHYLERPLDGLYSLKPEFDNQKKIAAKFAGDYQSEKSGILCRGLLRLLDDVLFIEDPRDMDKYHPRITPRSSAIYQSLSDNQRAAFDRLYEDFYYHRPVDFWKEQAMWKLPPLIDSTGMLCCGEDLGMIPSCVPEVMEKLRIFSLKVQRMSGGYGEEFADVSHYPYYSVCTTSTHDMAGIRGWLEEEEERSDRYFRDRLSGEGTSPLGAPAWLCDEIVKQHLESPSMLCILPLQDWLSIDDSLRRSDAKEEQINDPSNPDNNWNYRMHLTLEELCGASDFAQRLHWLITRSGR